MWNCFFFISPVICCRNPPSYMSQRPFTYLSAESAKQKNLNPLSPLILSVRSFSDILYISLHFSSFPICTHSSLAHYGGSVLLAQFIRTGGFSDPDFLLFLLGRISISQVLVFCKNFRRRVWQLMRWSVIAFMERLFFSTLLWSANSNQTQSQCAVRGTFITNPRRPASPIDCLYVRIFEREMYPSEKNWPAP